MAKIPRCIRGIKDEVELFHLDRDPSERYNVAERYTDIAQRMQKQLDAFGTEVACKSECCPCELFSI